MQSLNDLAYKVSQKANIKVFAKGRRMVGQTVTHIQTLTTTYKSVFFTSKTISLNPQINLFMYVFNFTSKTISLNPQINLFMYVLYLFPYSFICVLSFIYYYLFISLHCSFYFQFLMIFSILCLSFYSSISVVLHFLHISPQQLPMFYSINVQHLFCILCKWYLAFLFQQHRHYKQLRLRKTLKEIKRDRNVIVFWPKGKINLRIPHKEIPEKKH